MAPSRSRMRRTVLANPYRVAALAVALGAGLVVLGLSTSLFPYHSANHDEGVYLQQAAMLLDGRLFLTPGSEPLRQAVHPWFFVEGDRGLYPKYSPVPAALFAAGELVGGARLALGAVAALNVALVFGLASEAFDRRTGLVAAVIMAAAPLFLLTSAVFLPYAPTTALNLCFALAYVRSASRNDRRYAVIAGCAIGLAFFARPFTAVLFAVPFVAHAAWRTLLAIPDSRATVSRYGLIAGCGTAFVGVALAYNTVVTGSPLLFPYEAFGPRDGVGFGRRAILDHELDYTPGLALTANAIVLWTFATGWFTAGPIGTAAALVGALALGDRLRRDGLQPAAELSPGQLRVVLLGVIGAVAIGNLFFWGNHNILADIRTPGDGLIGLLGPFYHFDMLAPMAIVGAHGAVTTARTLRSRWVDASGLGRVAVALVVVASLPAVAVAEADAVAPPVERNAAHTAKYDQAYAPFADTELTGALVFLPPTYGEWRNHPFQWLRNDPSFDGPVVYVLSRNPRDDLAVIDAYPDRASYRYRFQGEWTPDPSSRVRPLLEPVAVVERGTVHARTTVAVPDRIDAVSVGLSNGATVRRYDLEGDPSGELSVDWRLDQSGVMVDHPDLLAVGDEAAVPIPGPVEVVLTVTITEADGATLTYREAVIVTPTSAGIAVLWPPESSACLLVTDCGPAGTYLPDRPETRPSGIAMNTTLVEPTGPTEPARHAVAELGAGTAAPARHGRATAVGRGDPTEPGRSYVPPAHSRLDPTARPTTPGLGDATNGEV